MENRDPCGKTRTRSWILGFACAAVAAVALDTGSADAQERRERREPERAETHGRFHSPHWVFDERYGHRHYYPSVGYAVPGLPAGNIAVTFGRGRFFFSAGVWFQAAGAGFVVVRPPAGIVVPVLPPAYTVVWSGGVPYYYANDVYYAAAPAGIGYVVMAPPEAAAATPAPAPTVAPPPAAPQAAGGTWYYCESAKAYYPYVAECREGWRQVPATPAPPATR